MQNYEQFLKKQDKTGGSGRRRGNEWTLQNIEAGFEKFYETYGHYPSVPEVDSFEYLPSVRQFQRSYGGIMSLRKRLTLNHEIEDQNKGKMRSRIAEIAIKRAGEYEEMYYEYLIKHIPEVYVHEHKVIRANGEKTSTDFFVYFPNTSMGVSIDLFYADDIKNLMKQVLIKSQKYEKIILPTCFVCVNKDISQEEINKKILNKKEKLQEHITVYNIEYFNTKILPDIISKFKT